MPSNSKNWTSSSPDGTPLTATTTSAATKICTTDSLAMARDIMVDNRGANDVYVKTGIDNGTTATSNSFRVPAGQTRIFDKGTTSGQPNLYLACLSATGTSNIVVYLGEG